VLATCKALGVKTVAEMIEREDQHDTLLGLGVDLGQGWLYGRPAAEIPAPADREVFASAAGSTRRTSAGCSSKASRCDPLPAPATHAMRNED